MFSVKNFTSMLRIKINLNVNMMTGIFIIFFNIGLDISCDFKKKYHRFMLWSANFVTMNA